MSSCGVLRSFGIAPLLGCLVVAAVAHPARPAQAEVIEPNGVAVPLDSANGEMQLSQLFAARGEMLDFVADGSSAPDGDFNDYVFCFEGPSCPGGGEPCELPDAVGVCVPGVLECDVGGELSCKPSIEPSDERCNALDDDCDGDSDEGDALCDEGEVCSRGQCVPRCGSLEFQCVLTPFTLCEDGLCIEPERAGRQCEPGQACLGGECRAPCDEVVCPLGLACQLGACVDLCDGVECGDERVCSQGARAGRRALQLLAPDGRRRCSPPGS